MKEIDDFGLDTELGSYGENDQSCTVAFRSKPMLLVDAVEIFLRWVGSFRKSERR